MSQHVLSGATVKLLGDFDNEIRKALNSKLEQVAEWFTLEEDKEGYFCTKVNKLGYRKNVKAVRLRKM